MRKSFRKILPERLEYLLHWRFAGTLFLTNSVIVLFFLINNLDDMHSLRELLYFLLYLMLYIQPIGFSMAYLANAFPYEKIKYKWLVFVTAVPVSIASGWAGNFIGIFLVYLILHKQVSPPSTTTGIVQQSMTFLFFGGLSGLFFELRGRLQSTARKLADKEINEQKLQRMKVEAELEALRTKVNPHFLFNTLNSIVSLIHNAPEAAESMVERLSALFRYTLDAGQHSFIRLSEEIDIVQKYLDIEKVRLNNRLQYSIHLDSDLKSCAIPPLLLQPLVENAIKHGIAPKTGGGEIRLEVRHVENQCDIHVMDTGSGFICPPDCANGFGLKSVRQRLARYYPDSHLFSIVNHQGTDIHIRIPCQPMES